MLFYGRSILFIMLSNNNKAEFIRKQQPTKQRFAIKKLSVGVASVLIGLTFMGLNASADANQTTTTANNGSTPAAVTASTSELPGGY